MKEKNKGKVFKQTPLTFEEKNGENDARTKKTQIENLTKLVQIQFDMIKSLQENKIEQLSKNGSSSKAENESKKNVELNESLNKSKSKNFMIDNIIKITSENQEENKNNKNNSSSHLPPLIRMRTDNLIKSK